MRLLLQVSLGWVFCAAVLAEVEVPFDYRGPEVRGRVFGESLGMMNRERSEYATNLAIFAANNVWARKASPGSLGLARRALGLALHLSPRNKSAVALDRKLESGELPGQVPSEYSPDTLAELLVRRAEVLYQQKGEENRLLARALIDLAVSIDPENEDAIYAFELQKIEHGEVAWETFTEAGSVEVDRE